MKKVTTSMWSLNLVLFVASCGVESVLDYTPVAETYNTNITAFNKDLEQCRKIASKVEADYKKNREEMAIQKILVGGLLGTVTGAIISSGTAQIASLGGLMGAGSGVVITEYNYYQLAEFGPRRVVDRCMTERGHKVLK